MWEGWGVGVNETKRLVQYESCECKCRLNEIQIADSNVDCM